MIKLRAVLFHIGWFLYTLVIGVLGLPLLILDRKWTMIVPRVWVAGTLVWLRWTTGIRYEVRGRVNIPTSPAIFAVKHQAAWETFALNQILRDPAFVLKRELLKIPVFGWYLRATQMIPIDRSAGAGALRRMGTEARRALGQSRPIVIFPEGTRGEVGTKLPYQPGVGALYAQLELPIIPVALNSGLFWKRQWLDKQPGTILIEILPAIPAGLDRRQVMSLLERRIEATTQRLIEEASPPV